MQVNGKFECSSHYLNGNIATIVIKADIKDALELDGQTITVTADGEMTDDQVTPYPAAAVYAGFRVTGVTKQDIDSEYVSVELMRQIDPDTKGAIDTVQSAVAAVGSDVATIAKTVSQTAQTVAGLAGDSQTIVGVLKKLAPGAASGMTQSDLHGMAALWPDWEQGGTYRARQLVRYENRLYFVLKDVASAVETPDKGADAYKLMSEPDANGVFPFSAPLGDSDAYGVGDRVTLQGTTYVSLIDGNKSIPGVGEDGAKYWAKA